VANVCQQKSTKTGIGLFYCSIWYLYVCHY
jgi:hypothetical protein